MVQQGTIGHKVAQHSKKLERKVSHVRQIRVENGAQVLAQLGELRLARRKALVQKREPNGDVEIVETSWGPQEAHKGIDYVAIQGDGAEYPYKIELWQLNMEELPNQAGYFRKIVPSKLIPVPDETVVTCVTIDGGKQTPLEVKAPDFICVGTADEVYPLSRSRFDEEFEWMD